MPAGSAAVSTRPEPAAVPQARTLSSLPPSLPVPQGESYQASAGKLWSQLASVAGPATALNPDLVMVAGPYLSLAGFLPFQVSFSELYSLGPLAGVAQQHVERALARYSRTHQRFGK